MADSTIEWTDATWNPTTGCTKISPGCKNCYAERMSKRLKAMGVKKYTNAFDIALHQNALDIPLRWKKPRNIFVNSMSDLFHQDISLVFIKKVFGVMQRAHWHQFQILTKRSERLLQLAGQLVWPVNVWMGVSVENADYTFRVDHLRQTNAHIKFLSLEPLLGPLPNLNLTNIHWVIVGGESGTGSRLILKEWVIDIKNQCATANVPFFFKQWGGTQKKRTGRELQGRTWNAMPKLNGHNLALPVTTNCVQTSFF